MSIQDVSAETLAKIFHHYREALAQDYDGKGSEHGNTSWDQAPVSERKLMVAAAQLTLEELGAESEEHPSRKYFAKPGEADWGC
jgi:hypothetical protein